MVYMEQIELRSFTSNNEALQDILHEWISQYKDNKKDILIQIYKQEGLSDYCIQLTYDNSEKSQSKDTMLPEVSFLIDEIRKFGLINHTIWHQYAISHK